MLTLQLKLARPVQTPDIRLRGTAYGEQQRRLQPLLSFLQGMVHDLPSSIGTAASSFKCAKEPQRRAWSVFLGNSSKASRNPTPASNSASAIRKSGCEGFKRNLFKKGRGTRLGWNIRRDFWLRSTRLEKFQLRFRPYEATFKSLQGIFVSSQASDAPRYSMVACWQFLQQREAATATI